MKRASIAAICSAALIAIGFAPAANAVPPLQSPAPTRSRWRELPATPTPEISPAPAHLAQQKTHLLMLPIVSR